MEPHPPPSTSLTRKVSKCANTEASCLIILQDDQNLHIINQWNLSFIVLSPSLVVFPFKNRIHRSKPQPKYPVRYSTPQVALPRSSEGLEISGVTRTWNLITHSLELTKIIMQCNSCRMLLLSPICSCTILRVLGQSIQRTLERHRSTCKKRDAAVIAWSQKGGLAEGPEVKQLCGEAVCKTWSFHDLERCRTPTSEFLSEWWHSLHPRLLPTLWTRTSPPISFSHMLHVPSISQDTCQKAPGFPHKSQCSICSQQDDACKARLQHCDKCVPSHRSCAHLLCCVASLPSFAIQLELSLEFRFGTGNTL